MRGVGVIALASLLFGAMTVCVRAVTQDMVPMQVTFWRFLGSTVRRDDKPGTVVDEWEEQIDELSPMRVTLEGKAQQGRVVPVHLHSKVTEVGQLELWCHSRDGKQRWKLEFNVREQQ